MVYAAKLWMSAQAKRNPLKRTRDAKQGTALLNAIDAAMPRFPLDAAFENASPPELLPHFLERKEGRPGRARPTWA